MSVPGQGGSPGLRLCCVFSTRVSRSLDASVLVESRGRHLYHRNLTRVGAGIFVWSFNVLGSQKCLLTGLGKEFTKFNDFPGSLGPLLSISCYPVTLSDSNPRMFMMYGTNSSSSNGFPHSQGQPLCPTEAGWAALFPAVEAWKERAVSSSVLQWC